MITGAYRATIHVMLAAVLLGATLAPPKLRHLHALADGALLHHAHGVADCLDAEAAYSRFSARYEERGAVERIGALADDAWHLHWQLFGIEVTLPDRCPGNDERTAEGAVQFIGALADEDLCVVRPFDAAAFARVFAPPAITTPVDLTPSFGGGEGAPPDRPVLLCDRARQERSGVQLA
jgi:hypothetical protein